MYRNIQGGKGGSGITKLYYVDIDGDYSLLRLETFSSQSLPAPFPPKLEHAQTKKYRDEYKDQLLQCQTSPCAATAGLG
jgi:hypothetical protein